MTFVWLEHLFGVGQVGQEVDIPKVIAVILLVVTFYRMWNGILFKLFHFCGYHARPFGEEDYRGRTSYIVFFEKTTDAYKILYDKRSLRHQFLYFLATLGRLYLLIILVILIG